MADMELLMPLRGVARKHRKIYYIWITRCRRNRSEEPGLRILRHSSKSFDKLRHFRIWNKLSFDNLLLIRRLSQCGCGFFVESKSS